MKMTLDLPPTLVKQVKLRALHDGKKLKDAFADLLQKGMAVTRVEVSPSNHIGNRVRSSLPLIKCKHAARPAEGMTPEHVAQILLDQEVEWHHVAGR